MDLSPDDALAAAPAHHRLVFENESVRVLETRIPPGDTVPLHTHCWPSVNHLVSSSDFVRRDGEGNVTLDSRNGGPVMNPGDVFWLDPLPLHTLENVGSADIHVVTVELKQNSRS